MNDHRAQEAIQREIAELLSSGRIIQAIKRIRELTGMSLREAKATVDQARSGPPPEFDRGPPARPKPPPVHGRSPTQRHSAAIQDSAGLPAKVQGLLRQGRKIDAIRALRESNGIGLKEANDQITAYLKAHPEIRRLHPESGKKYLYMAAVIAALVAFYIATR